MNEKYEVATDLLERVWLNIDWDKNKRFGIWQEFEGQVRALSRCYSKLEPFLDKLCRRFDSYLYIKDKKIYTGKDEEIMPIFRNETQIPILLLRLRREENQNNFLQKNND